VNLVETYPSVVVLGGGESGVGAAILAKDRGHRVFLSDGGSLLPAYAAQLEAEGIAFEIGGHTLDRVLQADLLIKSPGIPDTAPVVAACIQKGLPVWSEIEFAFRYTQSPIVAITGSNGKTTTTRLTHHILQQAGMEVGLGGNIGQSFALQVARNPKPLYVLEVSSFQLDNCYTFRPHIAILCNITPDHLDRYQYKMENYAGSKMRIAQAQTPEDFFLYCLEDPETAKALAAHPVAAQMLPFSLLPPATPGAFGAFATGPQTYTLTDPKTQETMTIEELALQGKHNAYNSLAAGLSARLLQVRQEAVRESLAHFESLEHRLETVTSVHGISFINDSKATNVNSTYYALESMQHPTVWIVGGVDKGNDYSELMSLVASKVKAIVCLGVDNSKILAAFANSHLPVVETHSMEDAVKASYSLARKGDTVLLSPCCASFDLFQNYEDRGRQFKASVRSL
jgi:UDP-N-acetylmuramoylalanine--D-glutamate ligase